ncbi:Polycystic kidney disease protein 1-like 2 [Frankliniella fusca]|uniref:Polycystic kidney disease protein 1-like 2 n=1 Tax=Frankliniella fusca TaxID=407009 RepID=A0AAE1GTZ6_9NEOP|nr:Polycystic kidney disease protein 1-like 2 [Frankliniella fusca]
MYRKLTRTEAEVLLVLRRHRQQLQRRALDTFLWLLWIVFMYACVTAASDTLYFFMQRHVSGMVLHATHTRTRRFGQFYDVHSYREFYEYLNRTVAATLLRRKAPFNETPDVLQPYVAFAADNVTRMIGVVRLMQQRMQVESSCLVAEPFRWTGTPCYTDYSKTYSDSADYGEGWNTSQVAVNASAEDLSLGRHSLSIWRFHPAWDLDSLFSIGQETQIFGGGYVVDLGRVNLNAEIELRYMATKGWLDRRTRGVFIEFVLYSPSTNIFCDVFLFLERTPASYFHFSSKVSETSSAVLQPRPPAVVIYTSISLQLYAYRLGYAAGKWNSAHIAFLVVLIIVSFVMIVREVVSMYRLGRRNYPFNWFDGILVGVITLNGALYFGANHLLKTVLERMSHLDPKFFISFQFTTFLNSSMQFGLGVLVVLSTVRCWRVLSFATHFQVVKTMLRLAYQPLLHLLSYLMLVQLQFAVLFMLIMGGSQENLRSLQDAYVLLLAYLVDYTADYDEFAGSSRRDTLLTLVSYWVFVGFMYFFFLNFFLGIVSIAFESAGEIVRQQEIEGFSMANLIFDELRYLFKLPGGKLRKDSSLFQHTRKNFIQQKSRDLSFPLLHPVPVQIHGETIRVARAELGAMSMMYKLLTDQPVTDKELEGAMAMMTLNVTTPMEERVSFPGPPMEVSIGKSWSGEELLDMNKLHTVMKTLNARSVNRDMAVDQEHLDVIKRLIKEGLGEKPPSTLPIIVRVRRGPPFQRRPMFRLADLVIRRRRCVQIRFRLRRTTGPKPKPKPAWRP